MKNVNHYSKDQKQKGEGNQHVWHHLLFQELYWDPYSPFNLIFITALYDRFHPSLQLTNGKFKRAM